MDSTPPNLRANHLAKFLTAALVCLAAGAGTACAPRIEIRTTPDGARIRAAIPGQEALIDLGKTPLRISERDLTSLVAAGGAGSGACPLLLVEKDGYRPERIRMPASRWLREASVLPIRLNPIPASSQDLNPTLGAVSLYFQAQDLEVSGAHARALSLLDRAIAQDSSFARAMSLKGQILVRQGKTAESILWFERALGADPGLEDVQATLAALRAKSDAPQSAPPQ